MQNWLFIAAMVAVVVAAQMFRYDVHPGNQDASVYVTDRWFGVTTFCVVSSGTTRCFKVFPAP